MKFYRLAARMLLILGLSACSRAAEAEDFDAHLFVVQQFLGSSFNLRQIDGDGNGLLDEDQLGLLSVILEGGATASGLNASMRNEITAGFNSNLTKVKNELTVNIGSQGTVDLVDQLNSTDPVLGNAMQKLIAGYMTIADTVTVAYVNSIADQVIVQVLTGTPESGSIGSVQGQINFVATDYATFGNAPNEPNYLGAAGDVDGDTLTNLGEYTTAGGDREIWLIANAIPNPPLRFKNLSGGGLAISGLPMDFVIETAGGAGGTTYEWRKGTPGSSTLLGTTSSFSIPFLVSSNSGKYFCTYSDGSRTRNTPVLSLTVTQVPIFIATPIIGGTRGVGGSFTFNVEARGGNPGPYVYTWRKEGSPIPGAPNARTFTLTGLQETDAGNYSVAITSNGGPDTVISGPVTLNVNSNVPPISITQQPQSVLRPAGSSHTFTIAATGGTGTYTYEWRRGGVALGAPSQPTLTIDPVDDSSVGVYSCFVTDGVRTALSNNATLAITNNPVIITTQPEGTTVPLGEPISLSVAVTGGSGSYTYDWRRNGVSIGAPSQPEFSIPGVLSTDGGAYTCIISDAGEPGNNVESDVAQVNVLPVFNLVVQTQPEDVTKQVGQSHTFSTFIIGGTGFYTYTWLKNGVPIGAPSFNTLTLNNIQVSDAGDYSCNVRDSFEPSLTVTTDVAVLSLDLPSLVITQQPVGAVKALGTSHTFTVQATGGSGNYSYEWRRNDTPIDVSTPSFTLTNLQVANSAVYTCFIDDLSAEGDALSDGAVLEVVDTQPLAISTQPQGAFKYSGDQHTLRVIVTGGSGTYNYQWLKDGEPLCGGEPLCNSSELIFGALATTDDGSYRCVVSDANFTALQITSNSVPLMVKPRLAVTLTPRGKNLLAGDVLSLDIAVTGGYEPVSYEWRQNGVAIPGALNEPIYNAGPVGTAAAGEYTCAISDGFAENIVSLPAIVNVNLVEVPQSTDFGPVALTSDQTVPPSGSVSSGLAGGTLSLDAKGTGATLQLNMNQDIGLPRNPQVALHIGAPGVNGPKLFDIPLTPSVSFIESTLALSLEEASMVLSGRAYVNITTDAFPNGELRGALFPLTVLVNPHSGDINGDFTISLSELLRVIQFYNVDGYHCDDDSEDGYTPGVNESLRNCDPHSADYNPADTQWVISLSEVLRFIQFFNSEGRQYYECDQGEDGYCPGPDPEAPVEGEVEGAPEGAAEGE
ncbi:MAG: hypothetical protein RLZZ303_2892 [Candidatus Hydrogenedentota bacterium]